MEIQFNTDKTINGKERHEKYFSEIINKKLERFELHLTKIEVYLSDQNGNKEGQSDTRCLLEAKIKGKQTIAVSNTADSTEFAVLGAVDKLIASLGTIVGKLQNH